jgi:two-component system, LytTR family, sensor kinase
MKMKRNKKITAIISAMIFSIVFALLNKWGQTGNPFKAETIMYATIILLNILITGGIALSTFNKFSKKPSQQLGKKILPAFVLFVIVSLIVSLSLVSIGVFVFYKISGYDTTNFFAHLFKIELIYALKQFSIWILIGSVIFFYIIWRKAIEREQILREENLKYKYRNLKAQVNPHFLFNSLNTLSELVYNGPQQADDYIQKLSCIYRYVLENEEKDLVSLKEELEFIDQYFSLQKARDAEKIFLEINVQKPEDFMIIPVSLQQLVENALKHNSMSRDKPLFIKIFNYDNYIVVSNLIQRKRIMDNTTRMGLSNLKDRVRLILGRELIIIEDKDQFVVKLPITPLQP